MMPLSAVKSSSLLHNIPTHVIAGPLGAGKTSLLKQLLAQRPAHERWAVLINEFGQIGIDAALLTSDADGIALGEVAGGCLCCVNGAPFQIGLGRLLRKSRPDRLFIEPSGLGHPVQLIRQLSEAPWRGVLTIQPCVMVLDAQALAAGKPLPSAQEQAIPDAGLLLLNKAADLGDEARQQIRDRWPQIPLIWTEQGQLLLSELPGIEQRGNAAVDNVSGASASPPLIWTDPRLPICLSQHQKGGWSIGWRWHPSQVFDRQGLQDWLQTLDWRRAKAVIHSPDGWESLNALDNAALQWQPSEWRQDSRLELIFDAPQAIDELKEHFARCRH